jgi:alanine racemase
MHSVVCVVTPAKSIRDGASEIRLDSAAGGCSNPGMPEMPADAPPPAASRRSAHVTVRVDLRRVRRNTEGVARRAAVPVLAVVKADAYGLGAARVAPAIRDVVDGYYVFGAAEAVAYRLFAETGRRTIALLGASNDPQDYLSHRIHPVVWTAERAAALRNARPVLSVDTGQQRFACPPEPGLLAEVLKAGECTEAMTHASTPQQAERFVRVMRQVKERLGAAMPEAAHALTLHAAGTSLLDDPAARLNAVRPGLALYRGAARVSARLVEVRDSTGPAGYTGFVVPRHGVILAGYSHGLRPGPCLVNGRSSRVLEVGMQSAFIECAAVDGVGDEVVLLGDQLTEQAVAQAWGTTPQLVLVIMAGLGTRHYVG